MGRIGLALAILATVGCHKGAVTFGPVSKLGLAAVDAWCGGVQKPALLEDDTTVLQCASQSHATDHLDLRYGKERKLKRFRLESTLDRFEPLLSNVLAPSLDDSEQLAFAELVRYAKATDSERPFPAISPTSPKKEWHAGTLILKIEAISSPRQVTFRATLDHEVASLLPRATIDAYIGEWCRAHSGHLEHSVNENARPNQVKCAAEADVANAELRFSADGQLSYLHIDDMTRADLQQFVDVALTPLIATGVLFVPRTDLVELANGSGDAEKSVDKDAHWPVGIDIERFAARDARWAISANSEAEP